MEFHVGVPVSGVLGRKMRATLSRSDQHIQHHVYHFVIKGANKLTDVAMHNPQTRIIGFESNRKIPSVGQKSNVSSCRIIEVKSLCTLSEVVWSGALRQNYEVMTVKMDGVRGWYEVFRRVIGND